MSPETWMTLAAAITIVAGRFHPLLRETNKYGNFSTKSSNLLRYGSLLVANMLLIAALVLMAARR